MTKPKPKSGKPTGRKVDKADVQQPWPDQPAGTDPASFPIPNPKQERFCQAVASGASLHDAYVEAGYRGTPANARRLRNDEAIWERIEWLQKEIGRRVVEKVATAITALGYGRDDAMREADEARQMCLALGQGAAAVAAIKLKAEIAGALAPVIAPLSTDAIEARTTADPAVIKQIEAHRKALKLVVVAGTDTKKGKTGWIDSK